MNLLGNKVFADVICLVPCDEIILNLVCILNPMTGVFIRIGEDTERHREEANVKMEVKIQMMPEQVKEC